MITKHNFHSKKNAGFTLVEMVVVIGIFAIISSIVLFNYGKFSSNLIVTNLAYQAALAVREAQVYGISVKQTLGTAGNFSSAYGVWFDNSNLQGFTLFADKTVPNNFIFDSGEEEESIQLPSASRVNKFCIKFNGNWMCNGPGGISFLSISFKRPNPDSIIYGFYDGPSGGFQGTDAEIQFTTNRGDKISRMRVTSTGQISIDSCAGATTPCQ